MTRQGNNESQDIVQRIRLKSCVSIHLCGLDQRRCGPLGKRCEPLRPVVLPPAQVRLPPQHGLQHPEHGRARARPALWVFACLGERLLHQEVDDGALSEVWVLQDGIHDGLAEVDVERDERDELARERQLAAEAREVLHLVAEQLDGGQVLRMNGLIEK